MKKLFTLLLAMTVLGICLCQADELNSAQLQLRSEIKAFLQEEGFIPEIDSDGDIKFKKEGSTYYVKVYSYDTNPFYVVLFGAYSYPEGYSVDAAKLAANEINKYKGIKMLCFDESYSIRGEMYVVSSEAFKYAFYKLMSQIESGKDDVMDEIKNAKISGASSMSSSSHLPFIISKVEVANTDENLNVISDYGATIWDYKTKYLTPRITVTPISASGTYTIYVKLYKDGELSSSSSSPEGYSYTDSINISGSSNQTFVISGWGTKNAGNWSMGNYRFEFWYDGYCIGSKEFEVK